MAYTDIQKPALSYRYEFGLHELQAAQACVDAHGFAVVKQVLTEDLVAELQEAVLQVIDPDGALGPGESYTPHLLCRGTRPHCGNCSTTNLFCGSSASSASPTS